MTKNYTTEKLKRNKRKKRAVKKPLKNNRSKATYNYVYKANLIIGNILLSISLGAILKNINKQDLFVAFTRKII